MLGLPIHRVSWNAVESPAPKSLTPGAAKAAPAVYFLHVRKCAGTTMRHIFENSYQAAQIMAPYQQIYYAHELFDYAPLHQRAFSLYRGHFGWSLPAALPNLEWRVVTILREPLDRLLSNYCYLKQEDRLPSAMTLEEWLDVEICPQDLMTGYFVPEMAELTARGYDVTRLTAHHIQPLALENLEKCVAVGLAESMDDTINLLAWHTGVLPPRYTARNNATRNRLACDELSPHLRVKMENLLESDFVIHERGREMFRTAVARLMEEASSQAGKTLNSATLRSYLRESWGLRHAAAMPGAEPPDTVLWRPDDVFRGQNLHSREEHAGEQLRWTGPDAITPFDLHLGPAKAWTLTLQLHRATPLAHAQAARLRVNGVSIALEHQTAADGSHLLHSALDQALAERSEDGLASFELDTPLARGEGESRMLGVALKSIMLRSA